MKQFYWKISLFRPRSGLNWVCVGHDFGLIALSFALFPFHPLHAPQAAPQKTSQIRVLLLQVASLADLNDASDTILMTSWCIRLHLCDILMYPTWFWQHFSFFGDMLSWFLWRCTPRLGRKHNSEDRPEALLMENFLFPPPRHPGSFGHYFS